MSNSIPAYQQRSFRVGLPPLAALVDLASLLEEARILEVLSIPAGKIILAWPDAWQIPFCFVAKTSLKEHPSEAPRQTQPQKL